MLGLNRKSVPVLMMHGVCDPVPYYAWIPDGRTCLLGVEDFDRVIDWCRKDFDVVPLSALEELFTSRYLANYRPIVLTFDDGLASTLDYAVPILKKYHLSATMFVTTDWIDSGMVPPIFQLERALYGEIPTLIELSVGDHSFKERVVSTAEMGKSLRKLWNFLFERRIAPLKLQLENFRLGGHPLRPAVTPSRDFWLPATWNELRSAVSSGAFEIGSHMKSHAPLTWFDSDGIFEEMEYSKKRLKKEFGRAIESCSYPHGMSNEMVYASAEKTYRWAFSNFGGLVRRRTPRYCLPRFHVPGEHWSLVRRRIRLARWDKFDLRLRLTNSINTLRSHSWNQSDSLKRS